MQPYENSFLSGPNASFIVELYARYIEDPDSVDPRWRSFFADLQDDARSVLQELRGASWETPRSGIIRNGSAGNGEQVSSEERRVGKAWVSKCRSRCSRDHSKKKNT